MSNAQLILALIVFQRIAEAVHGRINANRLLAAGGQEVGAGHYPLIVILHVGFLACLFGAVPPETPIDWRFFWVFIGLQGLRAWVMVSLGRYWTTRVITLPDHVPLVRRGPYRYLRHPNYLVVIGEFAVIPMMFGAGRIAVAFSVLNAVLLAWRIRVEDRALAERRRVTA